MGIFEVDREKNRILIKKIQVADRKNAIFNLPKDVSFIIH